VAYPKQPDRLQSSLLAAMLAVAGSLFFFDRFDELLQAINFSWPEVLHLAPAFLVVVAVVLALAERNRGLKPGSRRTGAKQDE
jgi:hypothetical protein